MPGPSASRIGARRATSATWRSSWSPSRSPKPASMYRPSCVTQKCTNGCTGHHKTLLLALSRAAVTREVFGNNLQSDVPAGVNTNPAIAPAPQEAKECTVRHIVSPLYVAGSHQTAAVPHSPITAATITLEDCIVSVSYTHLR